MKECRAADVASTGFVFVQRNGRRISLTTIRRHFNVAKKLAGIDRRRRLHDLRHSVGSKLARNGVPLQVIARILGHSSTRMTERYARVDESAIQRVTAALDPVSAAKQDGISEE